MHDVSIAILAGGQSRRMGQNKSFVSVQGRPMIEHILDNLRPLDLPIVVITSLFEAYAPYNLPMMSDLIPDHGALGGIYTALHQSSTPYVLCVASDMPFLNTDVLQYFLNLREDKNGVAAHIDGLWQTFPAVYHKHLLPSLHEAIEAHHLRMQQLFNQWALHRISDDDIRSIDPDLRTFTNINTPDELASAQR